MPPDKNTTEHFIRVAVASTTSTMDDARRLSAIHPCGVVRADYQSAGRGRLAGRSWTSEKGQGLSCTIWMSRDRFMSSAGQGGAPPPLAAGLALRRALLRWAAGADRQFPTGISLKWPNDLLCGDKKLAGILCEGAGQALLMGFGVNLAQPSFGDGYASPPCSVLLECGAAPDSGELMELLLAELVRPSAMGPSWQDEINKVLSWKGRDVRFSPGLGEASPVQGILRGIDASGALVIMVEGEELAYVSGELRPGSY